MVELVTFMVKGKDIALCTNISGGGLKDFDRPTEVSTEKCRVLIYHRESGTSPRRRRHSDLSVVLKTPSGTSNYPSVSSARSLQQPDAAYLAYPPHAITQPFTSIMDAGYPPGIPMEQSMAYAPMTQTMGGPYPPYIPYEYSSASSTVEMPYSFLPPIYPLAMAQATAEPHLLEGSCARPQYMLEHALQQQQELDWRLSEGYQVPGPFVQSWQHQKE
jgi:hypothetical protein